MTSVVTDSTVLIYLTRLGELSLLGKLFGPILVPEAVYEEVVVRGRSEGYRDAIAVEDAAEDDLTVATLSDEVQDTANRIRDDSALGRGEAAAIALARDQEARCLTDDHAARTTATAMGVEVGGTIFVLLAGLDAGVKSIDDYLELIDTLSDSGFRMSASLYRRAIEAGEYLATEG